MRTADTKYNDLYIKVLAWAEARGLFDEGATTELAQFGKTMEELGELATAIRKKDKEGIKDGIGDVMVTLIIRKQLINIESGTDDYIGILPADIIASGFIEHDILRRLRYVARFCASSNAVVYAAHELEKLAVACGTTLTDCLEYAYNSIKDRKGKMINGVFFKEEDLPAASL